jgi:hypothetical protein
MILPGGESRLQTLGRLAAQLFDSALRTINFEAVFDVEPGKSSFLPSSSTHFA